MTLTEWLAYFIVILAFALRVYRLTGQSIWYDEAFTIYYAAQDLPHLIRGIMGNHPPLHFLLLYGWIRMAGAGEFAVRFLSVWWGVLAVPLLYKLGRRILSPGAGLWAAAFLAFSPFHVWFSQETRMYALAVTLGLGSVLSFVALLHNGIAQRFLGSTRGSPSPSPFPQRFADKAELLRYLYNQKDYKLWAAYVLSSALSIHAHFYAAFILVFENLIWLCVLTNQFTNLLLSKSANRQISKSAILRWLLAQLSIVLLLLPWVGPTTQQYSLDATYWKGGVFPHIIIRDTLAAFGVGRTVPWAMAPSLAGGALALAAVGIVAQLFHQSPNLPTSQPANPPLYQLTSKLRRLCFLCGHVAVPMLGLYVVTRSRPKFAPRYLLPALPGYALLVGAGLDALARLMRSHRKLVRGLAALLLAVGLAWSGGAAVYSLNNYYHDPAYARPDFRAVVRYITEHAEPQDTIILVGGHMEPAIRYYLEWANERMGEWRMGEWRMGNEQIDSQIRRFADSQIYVYAFPPGPLLRIDHPVDLNSLPRLDEATRGRERAWLVLWQDRIADPTGLILEELSECCQRLPVGRHFHGISLLLFALPAAPNFAAHGEPQHALAVDFGGHLRLAGYDLDTEAVHPGDTLNLALYWEATAPVPRDYTIFAHLVGPDGRLYGQHDQIAGTEGFPTSLWPPGTRLRERFEITVHPEAPPGQYRLMVGLYGASPEARVPIEGLVDIQDYWVLVEIEIK